jgi:hypothetical protein
MLQKQGCSKTRKKNASHLGKKNFKEDVWSEGRKKINEELGKISN